MILMMWLFYTGAKFIKTLSKRDIINGVSRSGLRANEGGGGDRTAHACSEHLQVFSVNTFFFPVNHSLSYTQIYTCADDICASTQPHTKPAKHEEIWATLKEQSVLFIQHLWWRLQEKTSSAIKWLSWLKPGPVSLLGMFVHWGVRLVNWKDICKHSARAHRETVTDLKLNSGTNLQSKPDPFNFFHPVNCLWANQRKKR